MKENDGNEKLNELSEKVDALHKGFIERIREAQLETGDLDITYVSDTAVDDEPQSDDLLPVDTALMEKCIAGARNIVLGTRNVPVRDYESPSVQEIQANEFQTMTVYQTAQALFIGSLLDSLVGAVGDLRDTVEEGMAEVREALVPIEEL